MADKWPLANGNWSNAANWNGGTKPVAGDDVYADGKTVTIDENVTVLSIRNTQRTGGIDSGQFQPNNNIVIVAGNIYANQGSICIDFRNTGSVTITGTVNALGGNYCLRNFSTGTMNVVGNVIAGPNANGTGVGNNSTGILNITGNVFGGGAINAYGVQNNSTGIINITGNCYNGTNTSTYAVINNTGQVTITGNVYGTYSATTNETVVQSGAGTTIINGDCIAIGQTAAVNSAATGYLIVNGAAIGNDYGPGSALTSARVGVQGFTSNNSLHPVRTLVRNFKYGKYGCPPTSGLVVLNNTALSSGYMDIPQEEPAYIYRRFYPLENGGGLPAASNVRLGVVYNFGNTTGTLAVPPSGSVALGVPVDNGSGTAILTASDFTAILSANLQPNGPIVVERSKEDTNGITFSWPALGATITGQVSKNNGAYAATAGAISFLRTDGTRYYYTLAYNAADRPPAEGTARYRLTDGTYTKYFTLRVEPSYVANVSVTPGFALQQDPATKQDLLIYTDEEDNFTVDIFRQDGFTPVNLSGMNLQFKVSDLNDQLLYTIGSGNITIGGVDNNQITFPKASLTSNDFEGKWGLRDAANGDKVIAYGRIEILYVP